MNLDSSKLVSALTILGALGGFGLQACGDEADTDSDVPGDTFIPGDATDLDTDDIIATPTWDDPIAQIFESRCVRCHSAWAGAYQTVVEKIESGALEPRVSAGHQLPPADAQLILDWIADGYPER